MTGANPVLLFGSLADALDGIAHPGTEQRKKRRRGALQLAHGIIEHLTRHASTTRAAGDRPAKRVDTPTTLRRESSWRGIRP
jgi:hypothetical protein